MPIDKRTECRLAKRFGVVVVFLCTLCFSARAQEGPPHIWLKLLVPPLLPQYGDLSLMAVVRGSAPLHYQWYFNNQELPGMTNGVLLLPNLQPLSGYDPAFGPGTLEGLYTMKVTNSYGADTTSWPIFVQPVPCLLSVEHHEATTTLRWRGGLSPYQVESCTNLTDGVWTPATNLLHETNCTVSAGAAVEFYRIVGREFGEKVLAGETIIPRDFLPAAHLQRTLSR